MFRSPSPEAHWQPSYVAIMWRPGNEPSDAVGLKCALRQQGLCITFEKEGLALFSKPRSAGLRVLGDAGRHLVVLGSLFEQDGRLAEHLPSTQDATEAAHSWLFQNYWGSYLAFVSSACGDHSIVRDPSGGLSAYFIDAGDFAVVTDQLPRWLEKVIGREFAVDERSLVAALAMPLLTTHRSLLQGITAIPAGGRLHWDGSAAKCELGWSPASSGNEGKADPERMRQSVIAAVQGWLNVHRRLTLELSGGLDSAIILGCAAKLGVADRIFPINLATTHAGGDERDLARAAAGMWGLDLVEEVFHPSNLDYGPILHGPQPLEPNLYGLDPLLEAAISDAARRNDCDAILTGQGGDAVFFQLPTARVALDYLLKHGVGKLFSPPIFDAARRTRRSIWSVHTLLARHLTGKLPPDRMPASTTLLGKKALQILDRSGVDHPWLGTVSQLPPGKQTHALMVANCQLFNGPTRRSAVAAMRHPLMSQPVVESWLAAPTYELSTGMQDRSFARALFQDLLPPSIARRRGKGETSVHYRRALVENLPLLRSHLLGGVLVRSGLLNAPALDQLLYEKQMMWAEEARLLPSLASFESWARYWRL
jgi:asparagine synthase (glutamine-hydrolysing)